MTGKRPGRQLAKLRLLVQRVSRKRLGAMRPLWQDHSRGRCADVATAAGTAFAAWMAMCVGIDAGQPTSTEASRWLQAMEQSALFAGDEGALAEVPVTLTVRGPDGLPLQDVSLQWFPADANGAQQAARPATPSTVAHGARSNARGRITLRLPARRLILLLEHEGRMVAPVPSDAQKQADERHGIQGNRARGNGLPGDRAPGDAAPGDAAPDDGAHSNIDAEKGSGATSLASKRGGYARHEMLVDLRPSLTAGHDGETQSPVPRFAPDASDAAPPAEPHARHFDVQMLAGALLEGTVRNDAGRTVADAEVLAFAQFGSRAGPWRTRSDAEGRFSFHTLWHSRYRMEARKEGHTPVPRSVDVLASSRAEAAPTVLEVERAALVHGSVRTHGNKAIKDARITLHDMLGRRRSTRSDANGRYAFHGVPPGYARIEAVSRNLVTSSPAVVACKAGARHWTPLSLGRGRVIAGEVRRRSSGQPLPGAQVRLLGLALPMREVSNEAGRFSFVIPSESAAPLRIVAEAPGHAPAAHRLVAGSAETRSPRAGPMGEQGGDQAGDPSGSREGKAPEGPSARGQDGARFEYEPVTLRLAPESVLWGRVVAPDGSPARLADVTLWGDALGVLGTSAESGALDAARQALGDKANAVGVLGVTQGPVPTIPLDALRALSASKDPSSAAPSSTRQAMQWSRQPTITSRTAIAPSDAFARANALRARADAQGRFVVRGLAAGTVFVQASALPHAPSEVATTSMRTGAVAGPLALRLGRGALVNGSVIDEAGRPVADARVSAVSGGGLRFVQSDAQGIFQLKGMHGAVSVQVDKDGFVPLRETFVVKAGHDQRQTFRLTRASDAADGGSSVLETPGPRTRVVGRVVDDWTGRPISAATLLVTGPSISPRRTNTDANGAFVLEDIPEGAHALRVEGSGNAPLRVPVVLQREDARRSRIDLGVLALAPAGALSGMVRDRHGDSVSNARIVWRVGREHGETQSDRVGRFALEDLPVGDVELEAFHPEDPNLRVRRTARTYPKESTRDVDLRFSP